ncbi:MAG: clostripain-related cysteine peptidase [Planctomycetota bacterium]
MRMRDHSGSIDVVFERLEARVLLAANWTVMVYLDGDNDLEDAAVIDLNEMETVGSTPEVSIVVQFDRIDWYDSSNGDWTDTRRGLVIRDADVDLISSPLATMGELNMGDPATLTNFVQWGATNYPADHYALILWDHGAGTDGVCYDETSGDDRLTLAELSGALAAAGTQIDIVGFDACLMGMMETVYEIRDYAGIMVGSEPSIPAAGWPYDTFLADLAAVPGQTPAQLATSIVARFGQSYGGDEGISAINVAAAETLAGQLDAFAGTVLAQNADWDALDTSRETASWFEFIDDSFRDLGTFLDEVGNNATNGAIRAAAQAAAAAYDAAVIANHSGPGIGGTGLSIYFPETGSVVADGYTAANYALLAGTQWDEFLAEYVVGGGGGGDTVAVKFAGVIDRAPLPAFVVPGNASNGQFDSVPVIITNMGNLPIDGRWAINLYASTDRTFDGLDTHFATLTKSGSIGPGERRTFTFQNVDAPVLPAGPYYLVADIALTLQTGGVWSPLTTCASDKTVNWDTPQPDLIGALDAAGLPAIVVPGNRSNGSFGEVPVTVTNNGNTDIDNVIMLDLHASADQALDPGDTKLGSINVRVKLAPGETADYAFSKIDLPLLPAGDYFLLLHVDAWDVVAEADEANNVGAGAGTVEWQQPAPDLGATVNSAWLRAAVVPGNRSNGTLEKVPVIVANIGNADIETNRMVVDLYASPDPILDIGTDAKLGTVGWSLFLEPGEIKTCNFTNVSVPLLPAGNYWIIAHIDALGAVTETNEANNAGASIRTVRWETPAPDLEGVVETQRLSTQIVPGELTGLRLQKVPILVRNTGNADVGGAVAVDLYISDDTTLDIGTDPWLARKTQSIFLEPGGEDTYQFTNVYTPDLPPGQYWVIALVDAAGAVAEVNEANNVAVSGQAQESAWKFGSFDGQKGVGLKLADAGGVVLTLNIKGPGEGEVFGPGLQRVVITGTDATSVITMTTGVRGVRANVGDILVNGPARGIDAADVTLLGNLDVTGGLSFLELYDVADDHQINIGAPANPTQVVDISMNRAKNVSVTSLTPIGKLSAIEWLDDGAPNTVLAPSIASIDITGRKAYAKWALPAIAGHFETDLILTGILPAGAKAPKAILGAAHVAGDLNGVEWDITGGVGRLSVIGTAAGCSVRAAGSFDGIQLGAAFGTDFLAGIAAGVAAEAVTAADFVNPLATIKSVTIKGWKLPKGAAAPRFFGDSSFSAAQIGSVKLLNAAFANGGQEFGIYVRATGSGRELNSVSYRDTATGASSRWPAKGGGGGSLGGTGDFEIAFV